MILLSPRHPGKNMRRYFWTAVCASMLLPPLAVHAAGLGPAAGTPVMGEPLALEISLIEPGQLNAECFQLAPHPNGSDDAFFPRKAKLELKSKTDGTQMLVVKGSEFNQPVVEFRVNIGCGAHVGRDYVLLLSPGRELRYEPVPLTRPLVAPVAAGALPAVAPEPARRLSRPGPSIEQMAGSRYPHQPKARERFKQQLRKANPEALQGIADHAPIPLDVELRFPAEPPRQPADTAATPARKSPPSRQTDKPKQPPAPVQPSPPPAAVEPVPPPAAAEVPKDRLTISTGTGTAGATAPTGAAEGALQEKVEASFSQQEEMAAKLAQTEAAYNELKQQVQRMESRMAALEQERLRLEEEGRKQTDWSMLIGAVSILGGGLLGALLMMFLQRSRSRRNEYEVPIFDIGTKK